MNQTRVSLLFMVISLQVLTDSGISAVCTSLTEMPKDSSQVMFSYSYIVACILILTKSPLIPTSVDLCLSWESDEDHHGHQSSGSDRQWNFCSAYIPYWNAQGQQSGSVFLLLHCRLYSDSYKIPPDPHIVRYLPELRIRWELPCTSWSSISRFWQRMQFTQRVHPLLKFPRTAVR
jgi:hypothetical protein